MFAINIVYSVVMKNDIVPWLMKGHIPDIPLEPLAVFLPRDLSLQHLMYPNTQIFRAPDKQAWNLICTGRGSKC